MTAAGTGVRIGVDVGGTFTDVVIVENGAVSVSKTPASPKGLDSDIVDGMTDHPWAAETVFEDVELFTHGTTVATNAILEREWAPTALITTDGFRDVLEIGRQDRPSLYDFDVEKPVPIVERDRRFEVDERLNHRGDVERPLSRDDVETIATRLASSDIESVAIALLYAYEDDTHERTVEEMVRKAGKDLAISRSSEVFPEVREYERTHVTALNAALKPVIDRYLGRLTQSLDDLGVETAIRVMQSNGGMASTERVRERPVTTVLSGPAAGVRGAIDVASRCDIDDLITMDMGGTSCDVSLVEDGQPTVATDLTIGDYPLPIPMISIHTIGAGGGSIAWVDDGGAMRVGPISAGADPGPICYGRGGERPTVTDAQVVLGRLDPSIFSFDTDAVDVEGVRKRLEAEVADPLDLSIEAAADGILDIATASMTGAIRVVSIERGYDPRSFALVAFGGAGPLHAPAIARSLDIPRVVVPPTAGVLSAVGLLVSDLVYDYSTSMVRRIDTVDPADIDSAFVEFERTGTEALSDSVDESAIEYERHLDLRYVGQSFELSVPVDTDTLTQSTLERATDRFHERHDRRYGYASPEEPVELVTIRSRVRGSVDQPDLASWVGGDDIDGAITDERSVAFDSEWLTTPVFDRTELPPDATIEDQAIIEGPESTTIVLPGQRASVDSTGAIIIEEGP